MAEGADQSTAGNKQPRLPEVYLKWQDFVWSLEKLRHKHYNKSMRERDWFRINPLEMVLLGTRSLSSAEPVEKDHGTMILVMKSLRDEMKVRPRYWERLLQVFVATISSANTPVLILQRCATSLISMWKALEDFPEFQPDLYAKAITRLKIADVVDHALLCKDSPLGEALRVEFREFVDGVRSLECSAVEWSRSMGVGLGAPLGEGLDVSMEKGRSVMTREGVRLPGLCRILHQIGGAELSPELTIQLHLSKRSWESHQLVLCTESINKLVTTISAGTEDGGTVSAGSEDGSRGRNDALSQLLAILQLLVVRAEEIPDAGVDGAQPRSTEAEPSVDDQTVQSDTADQTDTRDQGDTGTGPEPVNEESREDGPLLERLFDSLTSSLVKWKKLSPSQQVKSHDSSHGTSQLAEAHGVPEKLLVLARVILAARPLSESIATVISFFQEPMALLVTYSTEGYLSNSPDIFLVELLEFVASLVEQGTDPLTALQTNLPNLFGPAFGGMKDHTTSCQLLQYGYLSVCSQHRKSLLTEGLKFLMNVFHLFPPIDQVKAAERVEKLHTQAVFVSAAIMEELLESLPLDERPREGDFSGKMEDGEGEEEEEEGEKEEDGEGEEEKEGEEDGKGEQEEQDRGEEGAAHAEEEEKEEEGVSEEERMTDRKLRLRIYLGLLNLACAMIRNGENISFLFATCLPKLFSKKIPKPNINHSKLKSFFGEEPPPSFEGIPWRVDIRELAAQVLELSVLCVENNISSPFQLCGIVLPKLVRNFTSMSVCDADKLSLTQEVIRVTRGTIEAGLSIEHFMSYGIDLLSQLCPPSASTDKLREFINMVATHFTTANQSVLLYLIKAACQFMLTAFPEDGAEIRDLFRTLLFKGKRDEIRCMFRICNQQLLDEQYGTLRHHLYGYTTGRLSHKQLAALGEILITAMDIAKPTRTAREVVSNVEEEEEAMAKGREKMEKGVVLKLTGPCLQAVETALAQNRFKKEEWEKLSSQLSKIALFRTLFLSEFHTFSSCTNEEMLDIFQRKFPDDVLSSEATMQLLAISSTRIEHMQTPRYDSLKKFLSSILRHFLTLDLHSSGHTHNNGLVSGDVALATRKQQLQKYLDELPRNMEDRAALIAHGYNKDLWSKQVTVSVKTDGSLSLEENLRQNLLACFDEFSNILHQMAVTHVSVDGEMVKVAMLFTEELSLADLKGRRAIAVRMIDQRRGGAGGEGHFYERKAALLSKEDQIESEFEEMAKAAIKPRTFTVALNTRFFDCAKCCGPKIIGCYAPNGEHCERPLEIGLRSDSAIVSIYDEAGQEIENAELLFTEEGAFLFKAYTNGHPYDTSQVWLSLFTALLKEEGPSPSNSLVPAVVIPRGYPNQRTWEALRRNHSTEITGSLLTCRPDFSPEWRTYYDHRPERVNMGCDLILHSGFSVDADQSKRPLFQRQRSKFTKDLAGIMFEEAMQELLMDKWWKQFRFLGKVLSQYVSLCVSNGRADTTIFSSGFDYARWKKTYTKAKSPPAAPPSLLNPGSSVPPKEAITSHLTNFLDHAITNWCCQIDLVDLCVNNHKQLLELKTFLEKAQGIFKQPLVLDKLRAILTQCLVAVPILSLPESLQEEVVHWVFRNEDRVWRYRGGRSGHETLQQFMNFLGRPPPSDPAPLLPSVSTLPSAPAKHDTREVYAGIAVFCQPHLAALEGSEFDPTTAQVRQMIGYAVGEVISTEEGEEDVRMGRHGSQKCYEVVTAWVHPGYRGLSISTNMYLTIIREVPASLLMCDMLKDSLERVIASNIVLRMLERARFKEYILLHRKRSYTVVTQTGVSEQFEQVLLNVRPLRWALAAYGVGVWFKTHPKTSSFAATGLLAAVALPVILLVARKLK